MKGLKDLGCVNKRDWCGPRPCNRNVIASLEWQRRKCQKNSAYKKFCRSRLKSERELRLIFKDVVATGKDCLAPSFIETQTQDVEQEDVYRPTMDKEEGLGDSEDKLFGVNLAVST